jgi:hypothetical protein
MKQLFKLRAGMILILSLATVGFAQAPRGSASQISAYYDHVHR